MPPAGQSINERVTVQQLCSDLTRGGVLLIMMVLLLVVRMLLLQQFNSFAPISEQEVEEHFNGKTSPIPWSHNMYACFTRGNHHLHHHHERLMICLCLCIMMLVQLCIIRGSSNRIFFRNEISSSSAFPVQVFSPHNLIQQQSWWQWKWWSSILSCCWKSCL